MIIDGKSVGLVVGFRDDTKRRDTEAALRRSELLYRAISDSIDFGAWICDAGGRNIYASPSFLKLTGLSQQECSDFGWARMLHPEDLQGTIDAWQECVRTGAVWEREHRFRRADGGWQHVLARGVPVRDDQGKVVYWAGINLDIQRRKEAEIALEDRVAERTQELLTARNDLRELSGRLLKTQDEERRRIARELHDGVGQLLSGMKMNFASIIKEKSKLSGYAARSVDETETLVDQALDDLRTMSYLLHPPLLDEIGLGSALQWYLDGFSARSKISTSLDMSADFEKLPRDLELSLFRIVQECLTNIHRHSGSPTALVRLYHEGDDIRLDVKDEGKGMPQHILSRVSSGDSFGVGFRGIRERLRQFNGRLEIQSSKSGTTVSAILPYDPAMALQDENDFVSEQRVRGAGSTGKPSSSEDAATILCIDDEVTGLYTRRLLLESAGHRVVEARSGPEGIQLFQSEKIDAVLLDYWMSGMKGTAVAAELKALNPSIPIIVLSGLPDFPGEATGVVDEWLLKGSNRAERLLDTIKAVLERRPV
jgi:PAS domain S-box-containing protein